MTVALLACLLWNQTAHCGIQKSPPPVLVLAHIYTAHIPSPSYITSNLILSHPHLGSYKVPPFRFSPRKNSSFPYIPTHLNTFDLITLILYSVQNLIRFGPKLCPRPNNRSGATNIFPPTKLRRYSRTSRTTFQRCLLPPIRAKAVILTFI